MAQMWTKLAADRERLQRLNAQGAYIVTSRQKPKSRLEAHAPQCARCRTLMKVRILIPGRKIEHWLVDRTYGQDYSHRCCLVDTSPPTHRAVRDRRARTA